MTVSERIVIFVFSRFQSLDRFIVKKLIRRSVRSAVEEVAEEDVLNFMKRCSVLTFPMSPKTITRCSEFSPGEGGALKKLCRPQT